MTGSVGFPALSGNSLTALGRISILFESGIQRWSRLSEQIFRVDKWSLCRG